MTDKQPEALRLAEYLFESAQFHPQLSEDEPGGYASEFDMVLDEAAAELRRLHEVNAELAEALDDICSAVGSINAAKQHYFEVNGDGRYWQRKEWVRWILDEIIPNSRAAIAKATGEQQ